MMQGAIRKQLSLWRDSSFCRIDIGDTILSCVNEARDQGDNNVALNALWRCFYLLEVLLTSKVGKERTFLRSKVEFDHQRVTHYSYEHIHYFSPLLSLSLSQNISFKKISHLVLVFFFWNVECQFEFSSFYITNNSSIKKRPRYRHTTRSHAYKRRGNGIHRSIRRYKAL
jgi:hypothetical protein